MKEANMFIEAVINALIEAAKTNLLERLVIYSILMESDEGITSKSPEYIMEKFEAALTVPYPKSLLDITNRQKFDEWQRNWKKEKEGGAKRK